MKLHVLACEDFRNLSSVRLEPHERFNILEGRNGHGKTNLLEAIYLLATFRSFRDSRNVELVAWSREAARLYGEVARREVLRKVELIVSSQGKRAKVDGKVLSSVREYLGHFGVVVFGPDDLSLSKSGPAGRRRFLDRAILNIWPAYLDEARAYQAALRSRNELLRGIARGSSGSGSDTEAVFASFDVEVIRRGARVIWRRLNFLRSFRDIFARTLEATSDGELEGKAAYASAIQLEEGSDEEDLRNQLRNALESRFARDLNRGYTTVGPHADDLELMLGGRPARLFASQGQHRALVLALKMAELQLVRDVIGAYPALLLDDVSSELDESRNEQLMSFLDGAGGQVFVTTTDRRWIRVTGGCRVFLVDDGGVSVDANAMRDHPRSGV